jgi:hypothetical protein
MDPYGGPQTALIIALRVGLYIEFIIDRYEGP